LLAILSKHTIKYKNRHIFNPANFALFVANLFRIPLVWNIESNIYLIIIAGIYIAYSLKKLPHIIGFLVFFSGLFATQGINPLSVVSWFFVFIMLIEPKTSGFGNLRGFVFGSIAGIGAFLIFKFAPHYDFFVGSLFVANLFNPWLERIRK
jgi:Na+-transporting NADH:ubiquinone oxidoreductase subunit NqrB